MKFAGIILFTLLSFHAFSQRFNGQVLDKATGLPVPGAIVKRVGSVQSTSSDGYFSILNPRFGDTIKITSLGYNPYSLVMGMPRGDTTRIYLIPGSIMLNSVDIRAKHDPKIDSITNRREFDSVFKYKAPTVKDAFYGINRNKNIPNNYITAQNSTASILNLDVLAAIGLFGRNKTPAAKLHQLVINKEKLDYVDQRFTKQKVAEITKLKGDSLENFIYLYRPPIELVRGMTEYNLLIYIKSSLELYKSGKHTAPVIK